MTRRPPLPIETLRRHFEAARAEVTRLHGVKPKGDWGRAQLDANLRAARANLSARRRELEAAEDTEARLQSLLGKVDSLIAELDADGGPS